MSANTDYYWNKLQNLEANPVAEYQSKYGTQIDSVLDKIVNREQFSYDFNADPLYQNYKDQYTKLGNEAAMNAVANVSALSGGYGNSYAATAGAQANQQYLTQLNQVIPELYNAAMNRYQMEGDRLNNIYGVLGSAEDRNYGQYRDKVSDYFNNLNYYQGAYGTQLGSDQWNAEFDYRKQRDAISDQQWAAEMALKRASAAKSSAAKTEKEYDGSEEQAPSSYNIWQEAQKLYQGDMDVTNDGAHAQETAADYLAEQVNKGYIDEDRAYELLLKLIGDRDGGMNNKLSGFDFSEWQRPTGSNDLNLQWKVSNYDDNLYKKLTGKG